MKSLFFAIIEMLKKTAPVSIVTNIVLGCVLFFVGLWLLKNHPTKKTMYSACFIISGLLVVGAVSTSVVSYLIF
ncbi:hypothetical protein ACWN8V_10715 [Vagococcus elongatus]|uniref:Uncharacterized protein n=1 Tax=Vagococcus elongatus TaxID=180344 RepID=A0A430APN6_9ENTE|nr:hypothetical protein [Vagococcus elongatus]RSU09857.1 hypothetical protein CBF29_10830 [Vagococcus elongatus]